MKLFVKTCFNKRASALLLSFFMMALLILVAISVSVLVLHDVRTVRTLVAGSQATYAAEGMSELGLYAVKVNLPGYEPVFENYSLASLVSADASIYAREDSVPCEEQSEEGWGVLEPNESVQLPLFAQTDDRGTTAKNTSFVVEFYVGDDEGVTLFYDMSQVLTTQDVLRWKILGLYTYNNVTRTEAISEYIPLDYRKNRFFEEKPTLFGPGVDGSVDSRYTQAKFYSSGYRSGFYPHYPIGTFLDNHDYNYLVLTNIIQGVEDAYIYYRLNWTAGGKGTTGTLDKVVCEYAKISSAADASLAEARQELVTLVKEGGNLPVFDFVLYHTSDTPLSLPDL